MVLMQACSESLGFPSVYSLIKTMGMAAGMSKEDGDSPDSQTDWEAAWKALLWSFAAASVYTLLASWIPAIHSFPVASWLGMRVVTDWGWEVTPSMGYIGQGMIMGPKTAFSMLAGAVVGTLHDHFLTPDALLASQTVMLFLNCVCCLGLHHAARPFTKSFLYASGLYRSTLHAQAGCAAQSNYGWYSMLWLVCVLSAHTSSSMQLNLHPSTLGTSRSVAVPAEDCLQFQLSSFSHNAMQHCDK